MNNYKKTASTNYNAMVVWILLMKKHAAWPEESDDYFKTTSKISNVRYNVIFIFLHYYEQCFCVFSEGVKCQAEKFEIHSRNTLTCPSVKSGGKFYA